MSFLLLDTMFALLGIFFDLFFGKPSQGKVKGRHFFAEGLDGGHVHLCVHLLWDDFTNFSTSVYDARIHKLFPSHVEPMMKES